MKPVAVAERVVSIDTLRGMALAGVLLVNLLLGFRTPLPAHILGIDEPLGWGGSLWLFLISAFVEFKAFTLFSFLFGAGVAIQAGRTHQPSRTLFLLRRFGALLAFGLIHLVFIWNGDILTLYAVCGLLLLPLLRARASILAVVGLLLIGAPYLVRMPVTFPHNDLLRDLAGEALRIYSTGRWYELVAFRWRETQSLILPLELLSLPKTLGLMMWGVAAWRGGLLENRQKLWRWILLAGAAIGLTGLVFHNDQMAIIPLAFAYGAAMLLWNPQAPWLAAGGRMALSNYLVQSIVFALVFYSYGFGLFGKVSVSAALAGGLVFYCAQLAGSVWWLRRFYFGPFEWLWRSVSYLRWQPFLR